MTHKTIVQPLKAGEPLVNLEGLADRLLAPREIVRDEDGYLSHPDIPCCDENVRTDVFLTAFGLEAAHVSMQGDCEDEDLVERVNDGASCLAWTPTPPEGDGWVLLEIFPTEEGPYALFTREAIVQKKPRRSMLSSPATSVDPGIRHMADQAGQIDRERLRLWLTAYGIASPSGDENMLAAIGRWVNEVLRCEPFGRNASSHPGLTMEGLSDILVRFDRSLPIECANEILAVAATSASPAQAGESCRATVDSDSTEPKAYDIPALAEKLKGRTVTISHSPYPDIDRAIAWVYGVDLGRAIAALDASPAPASLAMSEDRIDWLANAACPGGVAYPSQVKMAIRSALQESSRFVSPAAPGCIPVKEFIAKQRENPAMAAAMDRVRAKLATARSSGIFSDFNACMFREECRTRAAAILTTASPGLTNVDEIMRIAQMAEGAFMTSNAKDARNLIESVCDALSAILKRQSDKPEALKP